MYCLEVIKALSEKAVKDAEQRDQEAVRRVLRDLQQGRNTLATQVLIRCLVNISQPVA